MRATHTPLPEEAAVDLENCGVTHGKGNTMLWLHWITGIVLLTISGWLIYLNSTVFWKRYVKREHTSSWIPMLGGGLGAIALAVLPIANVNKWWWLPLLVDWGSLPGIIYTIVWHTMKIRQRPD